MAQSKPIVYLVGGAVRDRLLGLKAHEKDYVVVGSTPNELIAQGFTQVGKDFPVFLHPKTQEEYALARTERKSGQGYHGFECSFSQDVTLEEDLIRRDLTINAIAEDNDGKLIDPYGGQQDLSKRTLRHISPAFVEDPLRILRVARFAAKLIDFDVARETMDLMRQMVTNRELDHLPKERVWKETQRALAAPAPWRFFEVLNEAGAWQHYSTVSPPDTATFKQLCSTTNDPAERLSGWLCHGDRKDVQTTTRNLGCDSATHDRVTLSQFLASQLNPSPNTAEDLLTLLTRADGFRRPERWESVARVVAKTHGLPHAKWTTWLSALRELDLSDLINGPLQGKELGDAIFKRRCQKLHLFIEEDGSLKDSDS